MLVLFFRGELQFNLIEGTSVNQQQASQTSSDAMLSLSDLVLQMIYIFRINIIEYGIS